jgi:TrmH family RNA methyltransferase
VQLEYRGGEDSVSDPLKPLKWYKKLASEKGRLEAGAFLIEGDIAIKQIADSCREGIIEIVTIKEPLPPHHDFPIRYVTESQFRSFSNSVTPQGIMAVVRLPQDTYTDELPTNVGSRVLLLEDVQDPGNVGTLIRTAAAFDYSGTILTGKCADPFSPKCVQATAGTVLALWLRRTPRYQDLVQALKKRGYSLVAADLEGAEDTSVFRGKEKLVLALGSEASGLSPRLLDLADHRLRIPIAREKAESLNVASSGAICMYLSHTIA